MEESRSELRLMLRERRRNLTKEHQLAASTRLVDCLKQQHDLFNAEYFALYLASDGEINPVMLQQYLWQLGKSCYLPVVKNKVMLFAPYTQSTKLVINRFGIPEPLVERDEFIAPENLDVVFMPLTGFDLSGARLGMGGGFYDRTFEQTGERTRLIGLAHECQMVEKIPIEEWDVPLTGVVTDRAYHAF
ncbi:5-formyltetrahydrofolate cyclo-ligase [Endozoicomonas ascidiicola]|uniref:5-formyltetrahydrofolate cyclo-ligase n=1 Tax=Endozoicomonas ascidiicola TaxID=1698521 RepID=UPI000830858D|nr:5-formyltetrahydrofolate cyclo-ligase [Endozoicomonas ascidiicola]